jgi:hypothetical protein
LLGQGKKAADDMSRVAGLDNQGIVGLQRQVMKGITVSFYYCSSSSFPLTMGVLNYVN